MNDRIRVLHLARPAAGGMRRHLADLLASSDPTRFQHLLAAPASSPVFEDALASGIVSFPVSVPSSFHPARALNAALRLRHIWRETEPGILHLHGWQAALVGRLSVLGRRARPRVILTAHNYVPSTKGASIAFRLSEGILQPFADHTIAVSEALRDDLVARFLFAPERLSVIHNGINFAALPERHRNSGSSFRFGTVARLSPEKGIETFIQALVRLPDVEAVVVGDGPARGALERYAEETGAANRIKFAGYQAHPANEVATWDAFVLASRREAFGIALVEAMGQGVPVIGTRVGGIPEIIEDGVTGFLVEPDTPDEIAVAIRRIQEHPKEASAMAERGKQFVAQEFDLADIVRKTESVYTTVVSGRAGARG